MNKNDPAFPSDTFAVHKDLPQDIVLKLIQCQGMTIRTWLAGMAMQGFIIAKLHDEEGIMSPEIVTAKAAIIAADALLSELEK